MAQCPDCGGTVTGGAHFCSSCGSRVDAPQGRRRPSTESIAIGEQRLMTALRDATLGEYEIQGEIGRGGMAVVYLAHDLGLKRKVAIKVMTPALMLMDKGIQERFKREAQTAASLSHPHIIPVYAVKQSDDLVFFVMKYIVGRSLESVVKEVGALPFPVVQTILDQAGGALAHAHKRGVVHRDIKPGNIMLDEDGWVVVADFGIAKVAEAEALTMTGGVVGTPAYMSPEQCSGGDLTGAADQYALGIVAYEMVTGRTPFKSGTMVNLIYDHCHTAPPPILDARPDCPPDLAAVIERMIAKDPGDRFASIEEAVAATGLATESLQDAARGAMLTLAQVSDTDKLLKKFQPLGSPAPPPRSAAAPDNQPVTPSTPMPLTDTAARRPRMPAWVWGGGAVGLVAALMWFTLGQRGNPEAPVAVAPPSVVAVDVQPLSATLQVGETLALDAVAHADDGSQVAGAPLVWHSTAITVADITSSGVVTARSPGTTQVTVRTGAASASIVVTVTPAPAVPPQAAQRAVVTSVAVGPAMLELMVGDRARVAATVLDRTGSVVGGRSIAWTTTDASVASVDGAGNVLATGVGGALIRAESGGVVGSTTVTVSAIPVASVTATPSTIALTPGATTTVTVVPRDRQQRPIRGRSITWDVSERSIVQVDQAGTVTAVAEGTAAIIAMVEGQSVSIPVTVTAGTVEVPAPDPPRDHRSEIEASIEAYRQAINSNDLGQIIAVFPDMPEDARGNWRTFLANASALTATFAIGSLDITGQTATARIAAEYAYRLNGNQRDHLDLVIHLRQQPIGWRIVAIN